MVDALARIHCDVLIALGRYDSGLEGVSKLYAGSERQKANCTSEKSTAVQNEHESLGSVTREAVLMLGRKKDR